MWGVEERLLNASRLGHKKYISHFLKDNDAEEERSGTHPKTLSGAYLPCPIKFLSSFEEA